MEIDADDLGVKQFSAGIHRICSASATLKHVLPLAQKFGITRLANVTGLDSVGLPVVIAIRPNARSVAVSQGKGMSLDQAKASALMEAVEIWHAENIDNALHFGRAAELQDRKALVSLERLPTVQNSQFSHELRMLWAEATDLMSTSEILVPFEMVHADYTNPIQPGHGCFPASTNGLASGNHILEAICHGICEVIERDALSLWHHQSEAYRESRRISPSTVDDPDCLSALERFSECGLDFGIWDLTTDVGVATFMCAIKQADGLSGHVGLGSGSHPDRNIALRRAATEAAQTRLNYITGSRDDLVAEEYEPEGIAEKHIFFGEMLSSRQAERHFDQVESTRNDTLKGDLDWLLSKLANIGIQQVAVVDLTKNEYKIPVVRVIIPGLEAPHDDISYLPGPRAQIVGEMRGKE